MSDVKEIDVAEIFAKDKPPTAEEVAAVAAKEKEAESQKATVAVENRVAELLRKQGKDSQSINDLKSKVDQILNFINQTQATQTRTPVASADPESYMTRGEYQAYKAQEERAAIQAQRAENFQKVLSMFPELDKNSEAFDEAFYQLTDRYYMDFNDKDPEAPLKAAQLAALKFNKIQNLSKQEVLTDEALRTRRLSEGGSNAAKGGSKESEPSTFNEKRLKQLGVNPDSLKALIKANPDRYGKKG